jgi:hypothetical protein
MALPQEPSDCLPHSSMAKNGPGRIFDNIRRSYVQSICRKIHVSKYDLNVYRIGHPLRATSGKNDGVALPDGRGT